ncbi:isochorismate synthase [uncultured Planktosalinus sp.]|uniref:isochorismate synthase n=1 Tax=uncultured Planktosalinus sp. TaxID=1810935 RepID=UPI0030D83DE1
MDLDSLYTVIQKQYADELPFVIYRKPNKNVIRGVLQQDDKLHITSGYKESGFVFAPFDTELNALLFPIDKSDLISVSYPVKSATVPEPKVSELTPENELLKSDHLKLVSKGIEKVEKNVLKKVVLSRKEEVKIQQLTSGKELLTMFEQLLYSYPSAFVYCWYHPSVGLWMGASPESLFSLENKTFRTMSLAGTLKEQVDGKAMWSEKEKEEQMMVTSFLEKALEKVVPILMISKPTTIKAGNIMHIKTEVGGTINTRLCDIPCLIKKLHPTPAVCGLPKEDAKQFIIENEFYDREFYTGFLGELNYYDATFTDKEKTHSSFADLFVNLRCMKINKDIATLYVGGGITKDSNPEAEWNETVHKAETMLQILS